MVRAAPASCEQPSAPTAAPAPISSRNAQGQHDRELTLMIIRSGTSPASPKGVGDEGMPMPTPFEKVRTGEHRPTPKRMRARTQRHQQEVDRSGGAEEHHDECRARDLEPHLGHRTEQQPGNSA